MKSILPPDQIVPPFEVLMTAEEAYPALERAFLTAHVEIWASFRIFDLHTKLRSDTGRQIGNTWFDLIIHTLKRGVDIHISITDFDPVAAVDLHRGTWHSIRMFLAAAELASGPGCGKLEAVPALHSAWAGFFPRMMFWPTIRKRLKQTADRLNALSDAQRKDILREIPIAARNFRFREDGTIRVRTIPVPPIYPATHHQKLAVFDRTTLYIGGLDLNERRYDTPEHDRISSQTWHDVQVMVQGPAATEAQQHLETFRDVTAGRAEPQKPRRILRTLSQPRRYGYISFGPRSVSQDIAKAHEMLAQRSKHLIYIETQYFRDRALARFLARVAATNPRLGMILMLPAAPDDVAFQDNKGLDARFGEFLQARALRKIKKAFGPRLFIGCPAQPKAAPARINGTRAAIHGAPIVYIHAKASIFDNESAIVSSANLNGRSLRWDTEAGLFVSNPRDAAELAQRLMAHWLPTDAGPEFFDRDSAVSHWAALAQANVKCPPERRRGFILPYDVNAPEEFGHPLPVVPDEMV